MVLTNSADKLSDIPPIPCEDGVLKMLSLDQHVQLKMYTTRQKQLRLSQRSMSPVLLSRTKVMDENGIWQCADSVLMQPTSYWTIWS